MRALFPAPCEASDSPRPNNCSRKRPKDADKQSFLSRVVTEDRALDHLGARGDPRCGCRCEPALGKNLECRGIDTALPFGDNAFARGHFGTNVSKYSLTIAGCFAHCNGSLWLAFVAPALLTDFRAADEEAWAEAKDLCASRSSCAGSSEMKRNSG